jgi:hypothetical protein
VTDKPTLTARALAIRPFFCVPCPGRFNMKTPAPTKAARIASIAKDMKMFMPFIIHCCLRQAQALIVL